MINRKLNKSAQQIQEEIAVAVEVDPEADEFEDALHEQQQIEEQKVLPAQDLDPRYLEEFFESDSISQVKRLATIQECSEHS